jgi:hypothetical protein
MITKIENLIHNMSTEYVNERDMDDKIISIYFYKITMKVHSNLQIGINSHILTDYFKSLIDNIK